MDSWSYFFRNHSWELVLSITIVLFFLFAKNDEVKDFIHNLIMLLICVAAICLLVAVGVLVVLGWYTISPSIRATIWEWGKFALGVAMIIGWLWSLFAGLTGKLDKSRGWYARTFGERE